VSKSAKVVLVPTVQGRVSLAGLSDPSQVSQLD